MKNRLIILVIAIWIGVLLQSCAGTVTPAPTMANMVENADKLVNEGKLEDAFALYSKDIKNQNDLARAYAGRGNIYSAWRRFDEAISDFNNALKLVRTPEVLSSRCNAYRLLSKFQLAEADCKEALQLKPDYIEGYVATALLQIEQKNDNEALKTIQEGINKNSTSDKAYLVLSQIQFALGDLPGSFEALNKTIELQPKEAQYYCARGLLYYSTAQLEKSKQDYLKAVDLGIPGKDDDCIYKAQGMLKMLGK